MTAKGIGAYVLAIRFFGDLAHSFIPMFIANFNVNTPSEEHSIESNKTGEAGFQRQYSNNNNTSIIEYHIPHARDS